MKRAPIILGLAAVLLVAASAGASSAARTTGASASAFGIRVTAPGGSGGTVAWVSAPPDRSSGSAGWAYPADGSIVSSGSINTSASASESATASATASVDVSSLSLFGGEITASSVSVRANARASRSGASGDASGSGVAGLVVLGQPVSGGRVALGDWGYANVASQVVTPYAPAGGKGQKVSVIGLDIHLTAAHGGLPAGSVIQVGYGQAQAEATPPPPPRPPPKKQPRPGRTGKAGDGKMARDAGAKRKGKSPDRGATPRKSGKQNSPRIQSAPQDVTPPLTPGGYVFPVYGPSSFVDTWGAPRAAVGWHHGTDIFAPLGAPVLAVADGTVFSVGWNDIGGNRLWLRDAGGNEFY
ncbi:MAG: M23 family metallopeptidase, partial [Actinomycetota bacterium]|nr:M23 family metallopeptidase [Actinomycetota bacterium]